MLVRVPDVMLEDVDYQLTCDIISVAPVQKLKVKWLYRLETMETQTFNMTDTTLVTVSSVINVTAKARYNGGSFRCEAELDLGPRGPKPPPVIGEAPAVVHCEFPHLCLSWTYFPQTPVFILMCSPSIRSSSLPSLSRNIQWHGERGQLGHGAL